jgi:Ca-activated chloride channel family protein
MILSDYNKLRTSGARTDEVTKLGIDYNLLTAYTSFVAVDTEIRNTGDKPTTVTQPLPLPQGVSDYAVGGSMKLYAPAAAMQMLAKPEAPPLEDRALRHPRATADERQKGVALSLEDVTVSRNLSKDVALKSLREHLQKLEPCFAPERGKVVLRVTFNADGTVKAVQVLSGALRSGAAPQCIMDRLKEVRLPATGDGKEALATVTLSLS